MDHLHLLYVTGHKWLTGCFLRTYCKGYVYVAPLWHLRVTALSYLTTVSARLQSGKLKMCTFPTLANTASKLATKPSMLVTETLTNMTKTKMSVHSSCNCKVINCGVGFHYFCGSVGQMLFNCQHNLSWRFSCTKHILKHK